MTLQKGLGVALILGGVLLLTGGSVAAKAH
jgi:hypothetical protein